MPKFTATGEFQVPKVRHITPEGAATLISALPSTITLLLDDETQVQLSTFLEERRPNIERRSLQVDTSADTMEQAHEKAFSAMEWLTDYTAFMLHKPLCWELIHMNDHSSNQRQVGALPSMLNPKWMSSQPLGEDVGRVLTELPAPHEVSEKCLAALRWYHKGLASRYDIDRFVAYWVALELLAPESPQKPKEFMRSRNCTCEAIRKCPTCDRSTEYQPAGHGPMIRTFLEEECGYDGKVAKEMRDFRQFLHGAGRLALEHMGKTGRMVKLAKKAACIGIKHRLAVPLEEPPHVFEGLYTKLVLSPIGPRP